MTAREQTWELLVRALDEIDYTRDRPPKRWGDQDNLPDCEVLHDSERFRLLADAASNYAVLYIYTLNQNTYGGGLRHTRHEFVVPVTTYHQEFWTRWVFDRIASIEHHETCESFQVNGVRIYAPHHGNGEDPYTFWPGGTAEQKSKAPGDD